MGPTALKRGLQGKYLFCTSDTTATPPPFVVVCGHHSGPHTLEIGSPNPPPTREQPLTISLTLGPLGPT